MLFPWWYDFHHNLQKYSRYLRHDRISVSLQSPNVIRSCACRQSLKSGLAASHAAGYPMSQRLIAGFNTDAALFVVLAWDVYASPSNRT